MKIVLIHGQNHVGSSCTIGRMAAQGIAGDNEVREFFLPQALPHFCLGCYRCLKGDENCPCYAEKRVLLDALDAADVLIFTTPTYCMHASAPMKSFLDLTFTRWMSHRPAGCMFRKRALVVSTAAGAGAGGAVKDVKQALRYWGVPSVLGYGKAIQAMNWDMVSDKNRARIERDVKSLSRKLSAQNPPRVGLWTRMTFFMMRMMQQAGWGSDLCEAEYWRSMGWMGKGRPWKTQKGATGHV